MADESRLPARYEIRTLEPKHSDWANALVMHSTAYSSPVWSKIYPDDRVGMCYGLFKAATYLINHQIESGLSIGIFDKEYKFKRSESVETGGKLYWDRGGGGGGGGGRRGRGGGPRGAGAGAGGGGGALY